MEYEYLYSLIFCWIGNMKQILIKNSFILGNEYTTKIECIPSPKLILQLFFKVRNFEE